MSGRAAGLVKSARARSRSARSDPTSQVRKVLQAYADRGIFRSFSELNAPRGRARFKFLWLSERPTDLVWTEKTRTLSFTDGGLGQPFKGFRVTPMGNVPGDSVTF